MKFEKLSPLEERVGSQIVNAAYKVHSELGQAYLRRFMKYVWCMSFKKPDVLQCAR